MENCFIFGKNQGMKKFLFTMLLCLGLLGAYAQDPYDLDKHLDAYIVAGSGLALGIDYLLHRQLEEVYPEEFLLLDVKDINAFDRFATTQSSSAAAMRSDIGMYLPFAASATSLILVGVKGKEEGFWSHSAKLGLILLECNMVNFALTDLTKNITQRKRPYVYNRDVQSGTDAFGVNARKSFFSGHTSFSATNAFFFARVYSDYYPESKWKPYVWTLAALVPAWTGLERVWAGEHFPTDVIVGYTVGAFCGYFIPVLHLKKWNTNVSFFPIAANRYTGFSLLITH